MKRSLLLTALFSSLTLSAIAKETAADPKPKKTLTGLTLEETLRIEEGAILFEEEELKGYSWPRVKAHAIIKVKPIEAMAVFADFPTQPTYIPDMLKSVVVGQPKPNVVDVNYLVDIPWPLANADYVNRHKLSEKKDGTLVLQWSQVKSNKTEKTDGSVEFEPHPLGTKMTYKSWVIPSSGLASLSMIKDAAMEDMRNSVGAIVTHINYVKENTEKLLARQIAKIKGMLAGKFVYVDNTKKQ